MAYQGSPQQYDVVIEKNVPVVMRDGTRLAADVYRPALHGQPAAGRFPGVVERTPYDKERLFLHLTGKYFASHGYVAVMQDCRGRFQSEGEFYFLYNQPDEGQDGYDTIEWMAAQPWCDGNVGTMGLSFTGANQQAAALLHPPHLKAQYIMDAGWNYYDRLIRHSGAFCLGMALPYIFRMASTSREARADPRVKQSLEKAYANVVDWARRLPLRPGATPLRHIPRYERLFIEMATRADYEEFWKNPGANLEEHIDRYPDLPICQVTGWYGHHVVANFIKHQEFTKRNRRPATLIAGPWIHGLDMMQATWAGEVDLGLEAALGFVNEPRLRFFDRWLKGLPSGQDDEPPIRLFVMGGGDGRRNLDGRIRHGGFWRLEKEWPLARTQFTPYYLHGDGALSPRLPAADDHPSAYTFDPRDPVPTVGGNVQEPGTPGFIHGGGFDQRGRKDLFACQDELPLAARSDVLVFQTEPLREPVEVVGPLVVRLWVSSSAPDTDFTAKLVDVYPPNDDYPEGYALNLADSICRARYRNSRETAELLTPGQVYEIAIEPQPTANLFAAGHRIRLDISSSNFPIFDVNPNTGEPLGLSRGYQLAHNTVYHDAAHPSQVVLPVIPAE